MDLLKFLFSFVYPVTIEKISSAKNPVLEVRIENGKLVLNAAHANYSYGSLHEIFLKAFLHLRINQRKINNVLLLGAGGGSVPELLFEKFKLDCDLTAVEFDEKVIELAKKYFNIQRFKKLELICADAYHYVRQNNVAYDLVIVDLFIDNMVPQPFESTEFLLSLKKQLRPDGILLFNKIINAGNDISTFASLQKKFTELFGEYEALNISGNKVLMVHNQALQ